MSLTGQIIPRSALRHRPIGSDAPEIPPWIKRASRTLTQPLKPQQRILTRLRHQWPQVSRELMLGFGMGLMLLLILLSQSVVSWSMMCYDNWVYGTPRTYQTDAIAGHGGSSGVKSHFIALNNEGRVEVIEFPGTDATCARIYFGPLLSGSNADLVPVTLKFVLDHTGQVEMLVQVQGASMLFVNHNGSFQPASATNLAVNHL